MARSAYKRSRSYGRGRPAKRRRTYAKKKRVPRRPRRVATGKENRVMAIPSATFTAARCVKKFTYDVTISIRPDVTGPGYKPLQFCQFIFDANSLGRPFTGQYLADGTLAHYQGYSGSLPVDPVPGLDRWLGGNESSTPTSAPYTKYCVFGSRLQANIVQSQSSATGTGMTPAANLACYVLTHGDGDQNKDINYWADTSAGTTPQATVSIDNLRDVRGILSKNITNVNGITSNGQQLSMSKGASPKKLLGCVNLTDDPDNCGTKAAGPASRCKFRIGFADREFDSTYNCMSGILMRVKIDYNTLLYSPSAWTLNTV